MVMVARREAWCLLGVVYGCLVGYGFGGVVRKVLVGCLEKC